MAQATLERPKTTAPEISHACEPVTMKPSVPAASVRSGAGKRRLTGIDAARGIALLGMMVVHILPANTDDGGYSAVWLLSAGKSAALFAVVAGVGIAMTSGRPERLIGRKYVGVSASLVIRAILIGAIGLLLGSVVPGGSATIILPYYAILFVLAIPLLRLPRRWLMAVALCVAIVVPLASYTWRAHQGIVLTEVDNPTFATLLTDPVGVLTLVTVTGLYPALAWVAYISAGLVVGRYTLARRGVSVGLTVVGLTLAACASAISWFLLGPMGGRTAIEGASSSAVDVEGLLIAGAEGNLPTTTPWWLVVNAPHTSTPLDLMFTIGIAVAVVGGMITLGRVAGGALLPLAAIGSMPLTMYVTHLLLLAQPWMPGTPALNYGAQLVALTAIAVVWKRHFRRGPLEQVVRHLSEAAGQTASAAWPSGPDRGARGPGRHRVSRMGSHSRDDAPSHTR